MTENYFNHSSTGYCTLHGVYVGYVCPACTSPYKQTVTTSPVSTEDAVAAMVKAFNQLINDLRDQVAERDRKIDKLYQELEELQAE